MKVIQINATCGAGSTGKICVEISKLLTEKGIENYIFYFEGESDYPLGTKITTDYYLKSQALLSRMFGNYGFNSKSATKKLIEEIDKIKPNVIHLHNIHCHGCNLKLLFEYLKKTNVKIVWTFHDCWAFTGYCTHFDYCGCNKWKTQCERCLQKSSFSWFFDKSCSLFDLKKEALSGLNMTVVTPSEWLKGKVKDSFLKDYNVEVINNGIDLSVFKSGESKFKEKYGLEKYFVILGVAFDWSEKKGLDVFEEMAEKIDDNKKIVLVGVSDEVARNLSPKIITIPKTQNQKELAEIYSGADIFVNATREDTFPTVNIEALACGTGVLTYETGGSPEIIDESCGKAVKKNDTQALIKEIELLSEAGGYSEDVCVRRAENYNSVERYQDYVDLYERLLMANENNC